MAEGPQGDGELQQTLGQHDMSSLSTAHDWRLDFDWADVLVVNEAHVFRLRTSSRSLGAASCQDAKTGVLMRAICIAETQDPCCRKLRQVLRLEPAQRKQLPNQAPKQGSWEPCNPMQRARSSKPPNSTFRLGVGALFSTLWLGQICDLNPQSKIGAATSQLGSPIRRFGSNFGIQI